MKKLFVLILLTFLVLPSILAINLEINKTSSDEVMILDLEAPAIFDLTVTNNGAADNFFFYTFFGLLQEPKQTIALNKGETKNIQVKILPSYTLKTGFSTFDLFIQGENQSEVTQKLMVKIINLEDAFEIASGELNIESNSLQFYLKNKINYDFNNLNVKFSSPFFEVSEGFSLSANEKKDFEVELNKEDFKKLIAGFYTLKAEIIFKDKKANVEGIIKFVEKDIVTSSKKESGFIISSKIIEKENQGNLLASSETVIKKNAISRLFTSFNPEPDLIEREGFNVYYTWVREIKPGETLRIVVRTNWFIPLLIIALLIAIVIFVKKYTGTDLSIRKKVSFVRAKGGEFALKVSLIIHARRYVEKVSIIDRLPGLVKVYERFGKEQPIRVDEEKRRIEWSFEKLEAGEFRVISYIIYSKVGVVGKFALPCAAAIYEREGQIKDSESNRAFFMTEPRGNTDED